MAGKIDSNRIVGISKDTGVPTKKIYDLLFFLRTGEPIENNVLVRKLGVAKNALNQVKEELNFLLESPSKNTQLTSDAVNQVRSLFKSDYRTENELLSLIKQDYYPEILEKIRRYKKDQPVPERNYDQFFATADTVAARVSLMNFFADLRGKRLLFLGDDDFTSLACAGLNSAPIINVLDIDERILKNIKSISDSEGFNLKAVRYDVRQPLLKKFSGNFDVVFTDPPYTPEGIKLFLSRAIDALDPKNLNSRIYLCYGNSDRAKEKFLPIEEIIFRSGLMIRWIFDKFNTYEGAESIGSTSSLYILEATPKTKALIAGNYNAKLYTID